jgi:excisionase family DNA binding protein
MSCCAERRSKHSSFSMWYAGSCSQNLAIIRSFCHNDRTQRQTTKPADAGTSLGTAIARVRRDSLPTISERKGRVMADDREVLTVKEVCDLLRVHPATLYKLAREGKIPSFRIVSEWRFRKDAILRWMAEKSAHAQQVRVAVNSRVNGEGQHRRMAGAEGRRR